MHRLLATLPFAARWGAPLVTLTSVAMLAGCGIGRSAPRSLPPVSFLVSAGDSTFWVERDSAGTRVRRSGMLLTEHGGRFYELYLTDDDRSFFDAVILGQRVYRRDVASGDSLLLVGDSAIVALATDYAARHPHEYPLGPDEDAAEEPALHATTDTELLDASGPYLTIEQHLDVEAVGGRDQHVTRRSLIDVRDGHVVSVDDLVGASQAAAIYRQGQRLFAAALDSIRRVHDERGRRAATALTGFVFDSLSFAFVEEEGIPAVAFLVPGRGPRAGGYSLSLPSLPIVAGPWWSPIRAGLPGRPGGAGGLAVWSAGGYDVVAREDSSGDFADLIVRAAPNEWPVARVPTPVRRIRRLDASIVDPSMVRALRRAFDESALYSGELKTAVRPAPSPTLLVAR